MEHTYMKAGDTMPHEYANFSTSTLKEYYECFRIDPSNPAGQAIDQGHEPYLFDLDAYSNSLHPLRAIHDILIDKVHGCYQVVFYRNTEILPDNVLVVFK